MASTSKAGKNSRYVDMWAVPGLHPTNIELLQQLKTADSRHFTHNMDAVGTVSEYSESEDWEKTHLLGVRTDIWNPDEQSLARTRELIQKKRKTELRKEIKRSGRLNSKQSDKLDEKLAADVLMQTKSSEIINQRLVLKLFKSTTERLNWCGTIEEITSTEIHNSIATKKPLLTMAVILPGTKIVTTIQQNHRTARIPPIFSFCYFDNDRAYHIVLKCRWISLGVDFDVYCQNKSLGLIDSKVLCLGSDSYVNLNRHELSENTQFKDLVTLFAASIGYHKSMRRSLNQRIRAILSGKESLCITDDEELRLRHNGRAAA